MEEPFDITRIEPGWQEAWERSGAFRWLNDETREKLYVMEMFPYTSGRMHIGHARNYTMGDIIARMNRARGRDVLYPMGWDAFGLPAENAAILKGTHPRKFTDDAVVAMKRTMRSLGLSYDWAREVNTSSPEYVRAQQVLFLKLYGKGLVLRDTSFVNWCGRCSTVLANEQAAGGVCWRCGTGVVKRRVPQWFFAIRKYAQRLLDGLDALPGWPDSVKNIQRAWIGRSEGSELLFEVEGEREPLTVFTTRPDTLFGATFVVLAPEHPLLDAMKLDAPFATSVATYRKEALAQAIEERTRQDYEKTGVFTGRYATNPANGERVQVWVASYVLMDYGTGAIMAVPAHDQRDFEFASRHGIPIRTVIIGEGMDPGARLDQAYTGVGRLVNCGAFDGMGNVEAMDAITSWLASRGKGLKTVQYRLQNWSVSRQRYWGNPIPIVWCGRCGPRPVPETDLPVLLPMDVDFRGSGNPLASHRDFVRTTCPSCGGPAERDTDTMDTFVDSAWYFLRYPAPHGDAPVATDVVNRMLPVDFYIGGVEHATLHLMYARFFIKVLHDLGIVSFDEPFGSLHNHGMVNDSQGRKQSKSLGNVVEPTEVIGRYGADALRVYLMFTTAYNAPIDWSDDGPKDALAWLSRVWRLVSRLEGALAAYPAGTEDGSWECPGEAETELRAATHEAIRKVTNDVMNFSFNTAIAALMTLANVIYTYPDSAHRQPAASAFRVLVRLLAPFAPHVCEEIWSRIGDGRMLVERSWPVFDPAAVLTATREVGIQVCGRFVTSIVVPRNATDDEALEAALREPRVSSRVTGKTVRKVIHVRGRLVNIVAG